MTKQYNAVSASRFQFDPLSTFFSVFQNWKFEQRFKQVILRDRCHRDGVIILCLDKLRDSKTAQKTRRGLYLRLLSSSGLITVVTQRLTQNACNKTHTLWGPQSAHSLGRLAPPSQVDDRIPNARRRWRTASKLLNSGFKAARLIGWIRMKWKTISRMPHAIRYRTSNRSDRGRCPKSVQIFQRFRNCKVGNHCCQRSQSTLHVFDGK